VGVPDLQGTDNHDDETVEYGGRMRLSRGRHHCLPPAGVGMAIKVWVSGTCQVSDLTGWTRA
jgi:hypothetical protein